MLIDLELIPYASLTPDALVVITLPQLREQDTKMVEGLRYNLREKVDPSVQFLLMQAGTSIQVVDEKAMRQMGWVRVTDTAAPDSPAQCGCQSGGLPA